MLPARARRSARARSRSKSKGRTQRRSVEVCGGPRPVRATRREFVVPARQVAHSTMLQGAGGLSIPAAGNAHLASERACEHGALCHPRSNQTPRAEHARRRRSSGARSVTAAVSRRCRRGAPATCWNSLTMQNLASTVVRHLRTDSQKAVMPMISLEIGCGPKPGRSARVAGRERVANRRSGV